VFVVRNRCASTVDAYSALTGRPRGWPADPTLRPVGCAVGDRTACTGLAGATGGWLIDPGGGPTPAPALSGTDTWLAGRIVVHPAPDGHIEAHDPVTGKGLWSWPDGGDGFGSRILAVEPGVVHLVTPDREIVNLDANSGVVLSRFPGQVLTEKTQPWVPGYVYASHGCRAAGLTGPTASTTARSRPCCSQVAERGLEEPVVLLGGADGDPNPLRERAHDDTVALAHGGELHRAFP